MNTNNGFKINFKVGAFHFEKTFAGVAARTAYREYYFRMKQIYREEFCAYYSV